MNRIRRVLAQLPLTSNGWLLACTGLTLLSLGSFFGYAELVAVAASLLLAFVAAWLSLVARPIVAVTREVRPTRVTEGDPAEGVVRVENLGRRRSPALFAEDGFATGPVAVDLPGLEPGASASVQYPLPRVGRGLYQVGPLRVGRLDPLGLLCRDGMTADPTTLLVLPLVHRVGPLPVRRAEETEGQTTPGARAGGIAFDSLRAYVPGDKVRLIHWPSTARTGTLMVRQMAAANEARVLLVLDTSADPFDEESFEDAVRVVASLVSAGAERRVPTRLATTSGVDLAVESGGHLRGAMDALAGVQCSPDDLGLEGLVTITVPRVRGVSLGVVTGFPRPSTAGAVARVRHRFSAVTLIQVGRRVDRPSIRVPGVRGLTARTSAEFAQLWMANAG